MVPSFPTVYVVLNSAYTPDGIFLSGTSLQDRVQQGQRFSLSREDRNSVFLVTTRDEAVSGYFVDRPKVTAHLWR